MFWEWLATVQYAPVAEWLDTGDLVMLQKASRRFDKITATHVKTLVLKPSTPFLWKAACTQGMFPNLRRLCLKRYVLSLSFGQERHDVAQILTYSPNLISLVHDAYIPFPGSPFPGLYEDIAHCCRNLQTLKVSFYECWDGMWEEIGHILQRNRRLQRVTIRQRPGSWYNVGKDVASFAQKYCGPLQELCLVKLYIEPQDLDALRNVFSGTLHIR